MYNMELNKDYNLTTIKRTIDNLKVKVVGIITYSETLKLGFDVQILAMNEKVLSTDAGAYLPDLKYFKCISLDNEDDVVIVWSDIIDTVETNVISETYVYKSNVIANPNSVTNISSVLSDIKTYATNTFGVDISFELLSGDINVEIDDFKDKISKYEDMLNSLNSLSTVLPLLDKISDQDLEKTVNDIRTSLDSINDQLVIMD